MITSLGMPNCITNDFREKSSKNTAKAIEGSDLFLTCKLKQQIAL
jgi:hypothetical protein